MPGPQTAGSSGCWRSLTGTTSPLPACTSMLAGGYLIYSRLHLMNEGLREAGVKQDRPRHEEITVHTPACAPRVAAQAVLRMALRVPDCQDLVAFVRDDL